jgi:hypothetical protein
MLPLFFVGANWSINSEQNVKIKPILLEKETIMKKVRDTEINITERYGDNCLVDQINNNKSCSRRPQGEVHIYEENDNGKKQLVHKSNLVVYLGREMLAQRLVNTDNPLVTPTKDEWLQWFGLGEGGVRPADPLDPTPPINSDEDLYSPIMISDTTSTLYADPHTAGTFRPSDNYEYPQTGFYKKIFDQEPANQIEFQTDQLNSDRYLIIKITTTIGANDANGQQLSEAGLFSAESATGGYSGQFSLFARVTFPSLIKSAERRLIFVWYLYV